jgi:hypothetical protein
MSTSRDATHIGAPPARGGALQRILVHLGLPTVASVLLHIGVIAFLAFYTFNVVQQRDPNVGEWEGSVVAAEDLSGAFLWEESLSFAPPTGENADARFDDLIRMPDLEDSALRELHDAGSGDGEGGGSGDGLGLGDGALTLLGTGGGAGAAGTGGFGGGFGTGSLGTAGIWNLTVRANRLVYVVDFSGSIIVAVDDLKHELKRSIGRLKPSQSFNVIIFFSTGGGVDERITTESFQPQLVPATRATRRAFFTWIDRKAPRGMTEPLQAIRRALALKPQAVFFFSDGYFENDLVGEITDANRDVRASIHCLVFDELLLQDTSELPRETEGARRLKRVAEANNGRVKIVTGSDLGR